MPLPFKIESLDDVPEAARSLYEKNDDGVFVLPVTGIEEHEEVGELKRSFEATKDRLKKTIRERDSLKAKVLSDEDREEFERLREESSRRGDDGDGDEKLEQAIAKRDAYWQKELDKVKADTEALRETIAGDDAAMIGGALQGSLARAGVRKEAVEAAEALFRVKRKIEIDRSDGKRQVLIEDDLGDMVPLDPFVKSWAESDAASVFMPPENGGGGGGGGDRGSRGDRPSWQGKKYGEMSAEEKIAYTNAQKEAGAYDVGARQPAA